MVFGARRFGLCIWYECRFRFAERRECLYFCSVYRNFAFFKAAQQKYAYWLMNTHTQTRALSASWTEIKQCESPVSMWAISRSVWDWERERELKARARASWGCSYIVWCHSYIVTNQRTSTSNCYTATVNRGSFFCHLLDTFNLFLISYGGALVDLLFVAGVALLRSMLMRLSFKKPYT